MSISMMKTLLSINFALSAGASTAVMALDQIVEEDHEYEVESMKNLIKSQSKVVSTDHIFNFEDKEFHGREELDKYIVEHGLIEEYMTSSNLSYIIKDHQNNILDKDKIYGTDFDDFELAYRDAFGNALTSRSKALNSYTNKGLIRQKYSYDYQGWYDSPAEAKDNFVYSGGLEKSLYYQVDQRYYNLFNSTDQEELKSTFLDGYNFKASNFTKKDKLYGDNQKIERQVYNNYRDTWTKFEKTPSTAGIEDNLNYKDYIEYSSGNTVKLYGPNGVIFNLNGKENWGGVEIPEIYNSDYNARYFLNRWNYGAYKTKVPLKEGSKKVRRCRIVYYLSFYTGKENEKWNYLQIYLDRNHLDKNNNYIEIDFNKLWGSDNYGSIINLYSRKLKELEELDEKNKNQYLISTYSGLDYNISTAKDIPTQDVQAMYATWFPYFVKDELLNFNKIPYGEYNKYGVKRDQLYDINGRKGYEYSLSDGLEYYHNTIKPDLYKNYVGTDQHGNDLYRINNNFDATAEELENYMYLAGKQDIRLMYTFTGERNYSSIDGLALAPTQAEAQEKLFQIERSILSKKYFAYDVYGNYEVSGNNEDEAIRKLQQKVDLQAKYVHKDEVKSWNNRPISFENIISDGVYITYKTLINDEFVYFLNHHDAYNALTGEMNGQTVVTNKTVNVYLYSEKQGNGYVEHTYTNEFELEMLANKLLGYAH
ncbi:hypothetical protein [Spiroplasma alleghenense]|uniref:Uncharacterized protein n=1 Tax=Spiroplasma alleghenense TaxID=216931 RepID=A0A345Z2Z0_9MOLU|nr:hypothetical protein [Spiroplasma alleghenense]AXK50969.1 hypothetical protein SALLE_v1c02950 [Spiroplasma alleghenense]